MFNRNQFTTGMAMGILFPLIGVGVLFILAVVWSALATSGQAPPMRERTLMLLCICLNLIPFRAYNRRRAVNSLRGVVTATVMLGFLWLILYYRDIMAD